MRDKGRDKPYNKLLKRDAAESRRAPKLGTRFDKTEGIFYAI